MILRARIICILLFLSTIQVSANQLLPEGDGKDIVDYVCSQCHALSYVTQTNRTLEQWKYIVSMMINQGAPLEDYEVDVVIDYLYENYGVDRK